MAKLKILNRYATIPNQLLNDKSISLKAKGMYAFIQSKPDDWDFSAERIANQLKEGLPSVQSAIKELEQNGYLHRFRFQNNKGYWEVEYELFENSTMPNIYDKSKIYINPDKENLILGNPIEENPILGKPSNISKKDLSKKELSNTINKTNRELIFEKWFTYKKEKRQSYTPSGKNALFESWKDKSDIELEIAINHSMSNNYIGIFEPKQQNFNNNGPNTNQPKPRGTSIDRMEAIKNW
jgi:hypothetical protein